MLWFWFGLVWKNSASVVVPRLLGQHSPKLLIYLGGPRDSMGFYSHARYKFMCYVLYMLWLVCVCSHIFILSGAGQYSRWPWIGLRSFFPVYGGWYNRSLLCITFTFVYFSVSFIRKNGSNVVSSLLVWAILLLVTNFSGKFGSLKFVVIFIWCHFTCGCYDFNVTF